MQLTPAGGVAIALGIGGLVAGGIALATVLGDHDEATSTTDVPSPSPGPAPTPTPAPNDVPMPTIPRGEGYGPVSDALQATVDTVTDYYVGLYDHSGDGSIDIGWGQQFGSDERVTGEVGDIHTMVELFRASDADGDRVVTRGELRETIASFDATGEGGIDSDEFRAIQDTWVRAESDRADSYDERGVAQVIEVGGERRNNDGFFRALPDYRALT